MWVVRNEFISAEAKALECAKLELNANIMYKPTTLITAYYCVILYAIFIYYCADFSKIALAVVLLLFVMRYAATEIASIALVVFIAYFEYQNYIHLDAESQDVYTVLISAHDVIQNLGVLKSFGKFAQVNKGFYLLFAPFYLLLIAQKFSTRSLVAKEMREEHTTATAATPTPGAGVYLGKRIH